MVGRRRDAARPLFILGAPCCDVEQFSSQAKVRREAIDIHEGEEIDTPGLIVVPVVYAHLAARKAAGLQRQPILAMLARNGPGWNMNSAAMATDRADFACRLCAGTDLRLYYTLGHKQQFHYFRCSGCGLVNYRLADGLDQGQYTRIVIDPRDETNSRNHYIDEAVRFLKRHVRTPGRLIDVGCGNGRLLWSAKQIGWEVKGLELSVEMAAYAADRVGCEVVANDFLAQDPPSADRESFDVVSLRHVLEHLPDPRLAMQRISGLLRPGGFLLVEIPNIEGWSQRWVRFITRTGLHTGRFSPDMLPGHCCEYSRESFSALMEYAGYRLLRWETYTKKPFGNWLLARVPVGTKARALAQRLPPRPS